MASAAGFDALGSYVLDGAEVGARAVHGATGFALHAVSRDTVPQALVFALTPSESDVGHTHALEHLLVGKGANGRRSALAEERALAHSTAFTQRAHTCYALGAGAGGAAQLAELLELKLEALLRLTSRTTSR